MPRRPEPPPAAPDRLRRTVVIAAGLHALVAAAAFGVRPARSVEAEHGQALAAEDVELDLLPERVAAAPAPSPAPSSAEPVARASAAAHGNAPTTQTVGRADTESADDTPRTGGGAPVAEPAGTGGSVQLFRPDAEAIGLGRGNALTSSLAGRGADAGAPEGDAPSAQADAKRRALAALRAPLDERTRELGLGPEGPVLAALGEATARSTAPVTGRALIVARVDGTGHVTRLEVAETDGGRPGWVGAAGMAMSSLSGLTLRMPSGAKGGELRIEVSSAWKNPSGFDPGANVTIAGIPVAKGEGKRSARVDILDVLPHLETLELAPGVRVRIPVVTFNIVSGTFDPVDLGAQARRVVHTKLVGTTFF